MDRYFYFDDIFEDYTKYSLKISKSLYLKSGLYPIIDQGKEEIAGYSNKNINIFDKIPVIIFGDHTRIFKYVDYPFFLGADGVKILKNTSNLFLDKYLYYSLKNFKIPDTGYNRHFKWLKDFKIKYISLAKQERITSLIEKIEFFILKKEKQLEYLKELKKSLFTRMFGDIKTNNKNWEIVKFGQIISILTDYHANGSYKILKDNVELLDFKDYALMVRTTDLENNNFVQGVKYINEKAYNFLKKTKIFGGEIIINKIGSAGNIYLMPLLNRPVSLGMNQFMIRLKKEYNNIFYYKLLVTEYYTNVIKNNVQGAVTKTITKDAIRNIDIIVPPIELQNKFAERVEKIEKLSFNFSNAIFFTFFDNKRGVA